MNGAQVDRTAPIEDLYAEYIACKADPAHFIRNHCYIHDGRDWIPFKLWWEQLQALDTVHNNQLTVVLKSRQVGITWLLLCYALWLMLFWPGTVVLLFSIGVREAKHHIDFRLKGIYKRLPPYLKERADHVDPESRGFDGKSRHKAKATFELDNGSFIQGFAKVGGDSYTAAFVIVDEADLNTRLSKLLSAVKATIDRGGKMAMCSRSDKSQPAGEFKSTYRGARAGRNQWKPVFIPWYAAPDRDAEWYRRQESDILANTHSRDRLYEQYPSTDVEALSAPTLGKRLPPELINDPSVYRDAFSIRDLDALPGLPPILAPLVMDGRLRIYAIPDHDVDDAGTVTPREYRVGADPAEGLPDGDDSSAAVQELQSGRFVANLDGKFEPKEEFPELLAWLSLWYNKCPILVERNNHGHAVIGGLLTLSRNNAPQSMDDDGGPHAGLKRRILKGPDGKLGWSQTPKANQVEMWSAFFVSLKAGSMVVHDFRAHQQLCSIDAKTLHHPNKGSVSGVDDQAYAAALCNKARDIAVFRIRM